MSGTLKEALQEQRFHSDDEVKEIVHFGLRQQAKTFFFTRIQKLVERCEKCIAKDGDYVEK
jgi:hypothetical protein